MPNGKEKAPWGVQRERVFEHREEILARIDRGQSGMTIRKALKLDDVPVRAFHKNVATLRKRREEERGRTSTLPQTLATDQGKPDEPQTARPDPSPPKSTREEAEEPPRKRPPKKRKFVHVKMGSGNETGNYDPSTWKIDK